ncbi:hypothetical protein [Candidatus Palauibacter sp.]|uniref:hypothetical protein n=1 Tax=Candidatus Palauibacter sp. TaxID=3101350 RepID=UPI003AF30B76
MLALPHIRSLVRLRRPRAARPALIAVLAASVAIGGCGGGDASLDEDTYVQVMAKLTWARGRYTSTPDGDSVRAAVLDEFGVSGQQLRDFAELHGGDPRRMHRLWEAIRLEVEILDGIRPPESQAEALEDVHDEARQGGR